ncbi:MAG TPA: tetratricopeptide repeat protein [Bacteroidia bacterium]|nr:tetratricopeptide repeat protein [Bacteroidia bacterium]
MNCRFTFRELKAKKILLLILFTAALQPAFAQSDKVADSIMNVKVVDSLLNVLKTAKEDTNKVNTLTGLCFRFFTQENYVEPQKYLDTALALAQKLNYRKGLANIYKNRGMIYIKQNDCKKAIDYFLISLKISEELSDKAGMGDCYYYIGESYKCQREHKQAFNNYLMSVNHFTEAGIVSKELAKSCERIGLAYWSMGNYSSALKYHFLCLRTSEELKYKEGIAEAYGNIAIIYDDTQRFQEGLLYYQKELSIVEELNLRSKMATCRLNMGISYMLQHKYPEAIENLKKSLKIYEETTDKDGMAFSYNNIGDVYSSQENYSEALKNYMSAMKFAEEIGERGMVAYAYRGIGRAHLHLNHYAEAKKFLSHALELFREISSPEMLQRTYKNLSQLDSAMGNYSQALMHYKLHTDYKDSMRNKTNNAQIAQMKEQYESEKKDKEILELAGDKEKLESDKQISALLLKTKQDSLNVIQAENDKAHAVNLYSQQQIELLGNEKKLQLLQIEKEKADYAVQKAETDKKHGQLVVLNKEKDIQTLQLNKQKQAKNFLIAGIALLVVLSFFLYRYYRTRHQLKLQTLRNKIASDLHDDIGSTLSSISIFSQMAQSQSKEVIPALETIGESSRKMLDAMADIVWTINPENDQFEQIIMRMRSFAYELLGAKQIHFEFDADDEVAKYKLSMDARKNLYLIFKEATNNMVKYADASKAIFAIKGEGEKLTMTIKDNGKGFDAAQQFSGNGLKNMKNRALEIGGQLVIDSIPGIGTTIKFELAV